MFVRLALESDTDAIMEMARENVESTRPTLTFNKAKCLGMIWSYLTEASPTIWVVEHKREVIALMLAEIYQYRAMDGLYTTQEVLYVKPENRGSRASALLMKNLIAWSERLGAKEIIGGNDNEFNSERTARFLEHFGFQRVGFTMRRTM